MIVLTFVVFSQYSSPREKGQEKDAVRRGGGKVCASNAESWIFALQKGDKFTLSRLTSYKNAL
ncbi:MAG TPA: hypothetical protein OIL99_03545 [Clostridiales bacterium]|nr:hypothetical protein [Clostridiales bacterium]